MVRRAILVSLALLLAGCTKGEGRAPCPVGQLCFEAGNGSEPLTLDPGKAQLVIESNILYDMLIGLTTFDAAGQTIPGMATSWTTSPDGLVWTFHLRDASWSDGVPVTADDFVFGMRRVVEPRTASPYAYLLYVIAGGEAINAGKAAPSTMGVRAVDPHTLEIRLTHPAPYLPLLLVHSTGMPVPAHAVKRWGDAWVQPGHFVSNGPYTLRSWALGDRITLVRNPHFYAADDVCFDRINYYPTTDAVSAERRVESGELDMMILFASNRAPYLRQKIPAYVHVGPVFGTLYLTLNRHVPALADPRVRLALSLSIDRDFIANRLLRAGQSPLYNFVPPGMANYAGIAPPAWAAWSFARRQAEARRLLTAAGYGPDHPLHLELKYSNTGDSIVAPALQSDWRSIGADIALAPEEGQILFADLNARAFDLGIDSWYLDFNDPVTFLQLLTSSAGPQNHSDYESPRYDALMARSDNERDVARRAALLAQAEATAMADVPVAPIYVASARNLVNPDVTGWQENPGDWHLKRYLCRAGAHPHR